MPKNIFEQYPYFLNPNGWYEVIPPKSNNDVEKIIQLSSPIIPKNKFLDPSNGVEKLIISDGQDIERIEISDILTSFKLPGLIKFGFNINERYIKSLSYALQSMRQSLPLSKLYTGVGVLKSDNDEIIISLNEPHFSKEIQSNQTNEIICHNKYDLKPKGSFQKWWEMYLKEVRGNLMLEIAVIFSVSSLVTAFLKAKHEVEFAGTIFSFTGNSSTGKSTAAALAVSIAGNPNKGTETLFRSWNGTRNAIEGYLQNNVGVPLSFDELSSATFSKITELLYSIAEGQGRQRANIHGEVKAPKNWGTSIFSTSEYSIFNDAARNVGLNVRTIEISEIFTTSAENADAIKKVISTDYGHVMPLVADYLLSRENEVIKWFNEEHKWFKTQLKDETNNTGIRMFKRYAVIVTSARILERIIATPIDLNAIRDYLLNYHLDSVSERSLADKAIDVIVQFVAQYRNKFSDDGQLSNLLEGFGLIELKDDHIQVKIIAKVFKDMLNNNQFQDTKNVVEALKEKDYMESDRGRKTTKRSVTDKQGKKQSVVFYHIKIDKSFAPILGLSSSAIPFTPPQFDGTTNKNLLDDFVTKAKQWEENDDLGL